MLNRLIVGPSGKTLFTNLKEDCNKCVELCNSNSKIIEHCSAFEEKRRSGKVTNGLSLIYMCTSQIDLLKSPRLFKEKILAYADMLKELELLKHEIKEDVNQETKRLIHNLTSLNAHSIQELYNLVPQDLLTKDFRNQINTIRELIFKNLNDAASTFLRMAKNNASMKTEFAVFNKLYELNPSLQIKKHTVRKVIFNLLYIFFQDFTDENIYVNVEENSDKILFDYESIHVALYHLFENATKYAKPNQEISITFFRAATHFDIKIRMISIKITDVDIVNIFQENYSGEFAKKINRAGSGIGLSQVKRVLTLNNAELLINRNVDQKNHGTSDKTPYENNEFIIRFAY
ncbi:ATP-binding protein [Pedobacter sp. ASV1-7]|uniref:ATP-binding protein n=1 Tax=Pedobacter sp. ASV1-7 TaxID=3145237 RepID=UPI0032E92ABE